ncbi:MAG: hypothetical protein JW863_23640 [Chitinispirillaceae bacterium]|nr:hypothetical protein [Chitinispirillaceae bacterium]
MLKSYTLPVTIAVFVGTLFAGEINDEQMGYSIFLPDGWEKTAVSTSQHRFEDTSGVYQSMVVINRYDFSSETVYEVPDDWTRANFIAYVFSIEADPFSTIAYYDSVTAIQNETLWAADAFSRFFSTDTILGDWAEYIRFTATGTFGYEIYAIGPAEDMLVNVGMYVAIIEEIILPESEVSITSHRDVAPLPVLRRTLQTGTMVDILGRTAAGSTVNRAGNILITGPVGTLRARTRVVLR